MCQLVVSVFFLVCCLHRSSVFVMSDVFINDIQVHVCCLVLRSPLISRSLHIGSCVTGALCGFHPTPSSLCCSSLTKYPR